MGDLDRSNIMMLPDGYSEWRKNIEELIEALIAEDERMRLGENNA